MTTVTDALFGLERDLDKYPPGSPDWALNRRLVLRRALEALEAEARKAGHQEGLRDAREAAFAEREWEREHGRDAEDDDAPN